jgi:alpha-beta hydrolase superfamily lysophospholipase
MTATASDMRDEDNSISNGEVNLFVRSWRPTRPVCVIAVVPGFDARSAHYGWAADRCVQTGLAVPPPARPCH